MMYADFLHWKGSLRIFSYIPVYLVLFRSFAVEVIFVIKRSLSGASIPLCTLQSFP